MTTERTADVELVIIKRQVRIVEARGSWVVLLPAARVPAAVGFAPPRVLKADTAADALRKVKASNRRKAKRDKALVVDVIQWVPRSRVGRMVVSAIAGA